MNIERVFINAVVMIAAGAALIKFALFEWEGVLQAWRRVTTAHKPREKANSQIES
jgi:hypothetical protein